MTDYTWPTDLIPSSSALSWMDNAVRFTSPFTGAVRRYRRTGGRWRLTMSFNSLTRAKAQQLEAFLWRLDGMANVAVIPDYGYKKQGNATGTVTVSGAGQTGRTLLTTGWATTGVYLKAGDRFTLNNQLLVLAQDATVSGGSDQYLKDEDGNQVLTEGGDPILIESGKAQLLLTHSLRSSPSDGASVNITQPTARFLLVDRPDSAASPGVFKSISCEFEEAID